MTPTNLTVGRKGKVGKRVSEREREGGEGKTQFWIIDPVVIVCLLAMRSFAELHNLCTYVVASFSTHLKYVQI